MNTQRIKIVEHNGKKVHIIDYSHISVVSEFVKVVALVDAFNEEQINAGRKDFLILSDLTKSFIYGEAMDALKKSGAKIKPYTKKTALLGITGGKSVLLKAANTLLNLNIKPFDNATEALNWLTE